MSFLRGASPPKENPGSAPEHYMTLTDSLSSDNVDPEKKELVKTIAYVLS